LLGPVTIHLEPPRPSARQDPNHIVAAQAVREIGTNAIPHLMEVLSTRDGKLRNVARRWVRKQGLFSIRIPSADQEHAQALSALAELEPATFWVWVEILTNKTMTVPARRCAAGRLAAFGSQGVAALPIYWNVFTNTADPQIQVYMRHAVRRCNPERFNTALKDRPELHESIHVSAEWPLGKSGDEAVAALANLLEGGTAGQRDAALQGLARFGSKAAWTSNLVRAAMKDQEFLVRRAATNALIQVLRPQKPFTNPLRIDPE
jgi:hypothetical protein